MPICSRCGGSGTLLRPLKRKLLTYEPCPRCAGSGIAPHIGTLEIFLREMRADGRYFGRRAREDEALRCGRVECQTRGPL